MIRAGLPCNAEGADGGNAATLQARRPVLSESEACFRDISDAAPVLIWITDASAACTWFNKAVLEFTGRPMEDGLGMGFINFIHPDDREFVARTFLEIHQRHEPIRIRFRARRHDGQWRMLEETAVARFASDGSFLGFIGSCMDMTEQHCALEALREGEEKLRLATESAEIGLWDFDVLNGIASPDARVKQMFGMAPDDRATKEEFFALVHQDDRKAVTAAFAEAFDPARRPMYDVEYRVTGRDGIERWLAAKGRGVFDDKGRCVRVIGTAMDITARRRTEEALRRQEEQLRLATDFAEVGFWDADLLADTMYWSPRVKAMFGMAPDTAVTHGEFRAAIHADDRERIFAAIAAAIDPEHRAPYDVEYRTVGKNDGVERWLAAKGRAIFDEQNRCVRMLGIVGDITGRKHVERQLRELNERLEQRVAERTADLQSIQTFYVHSSECHATLSLREDGKFEYDAINPATLRVYQMSRDHVIGRTVDDVFEPSIAAELNAHLTKAVGQDSPYRYSRRQGKSVVEAVVTPIPAESGGRRRLAVTARDITERQNLEDQLHQAQKMEAMGNLTGGIAHDFNNLLQAVTGSLDLIRRRADNPERVRQWAEAGLIAADRGAKLTAQLLAFSRAQKLELRPLNLARLLSNMGELFGRTIGPNVHVRTTLDDCLPPVLGDETQLELALLNLAINARDAMPGGGDLIIVARRRTVSGDGELPRGDYVELSVTDTGRGMTPDVAARAFDPFFTTKEVGRGTGLGLSQVYGMARQAGGAARLRSAPGEGTTVSLFLRLAAGDVDRNVARDGAENTAQPDPAHILVVDDDPDVRRFFEDSLGGLGYSVTLAENGIQGLEMLGREQPDLMIVDYAMPGMTGAELSNRVRAMNASLPIIFASGYAETSALERATDEKTFVLRKPFRLSELQRALTRALQKK